VTKGCNKVVDPLWAGILVRMPRTIWKGALSFGLVNIPVGLYPATSDKSIHFNQFEEGTSDRIRYKKVNERTGEEVSQDRIVRGFDLGGGEYVILSEEELESAEPKKSRQIEISDFVGLVDIDPVYFRSSYYLAPEGAGADKAYALLRRAMAEAGRVAIATLVMRNKEYLVAIRPEDDALALHTMYFSDEVRAPGRDLELPETGDVTERELSMAQLLIESMESEWDPGRFHDTHREKVEALIEEKRNGHEIVLQEGPEPVAKVVDLMEALNASIAAAAKPGSAKSPKRAPAAKRAPAKSAPAKKAAKAAKQPAGAKTAARRKAS
jgi:DNA end-binding protein Ku